MRKMSLRISNKTHFFGKIPVPVQTADPITFEPYDTQHPVTFNRNNNINTQKRKYRSGSGKKSHKTDTMISIKIMQTTKQAHPANQHRIIEATKSIRRPYRIEMPYGSQVAHTKANETVFCVRLNQHGVYFSSSTDGTVLSR